MTAQDKTPDTYTTALLEQYGRFMTYPQAATETAMSVRTLKRLTAAGNLPCYSPKGARILRVRTEDIANLLRQVA